MIRKRSPTIPISLTFLHIAGAVCLLLWGTRRVKRGFTRAFGSNLRLFISKSMRNRFVAFGSGIFTTGLLQSSTAATLLMLSFIKKHPIALPAALAFVIGADVATTLVTKVFSLDLSWLSPALLTVGIIGSLKFERGGQARHYFSIIVGLGLMLLALGLIREATAPLQQSETLPYIVKALQNDPLVAILFAALLTWIIHSSMATVLLLAAFAAGGIIDLQLGYLMVLGANLGGAMCIFAATYREGLEARRVTTGGVIMRCLSVVIFAFLEPYILPKLETLGTGTEHIMVNIHIAVNVLSALIFIPSVGWVAKISQKIFAEPKNKKPEEHEPVYLDNQALETPSIALACAARETLRMAEMVEDMLERTIESFEENTDHLAEQISERDDTIDILYHHIKNYLARLTQESLDREEADRYFQILTFATNLEHVGDIIDKSLMELAKKKIYRGEKFSTEGWKEIRNFHAAVLKNMQLSQNIFLSEDSDLARQLIDNKTYIRHAEQQTSNLHFKRLSAGLAETIATSSLHLDIIRDYRRINSHITSVAYQIIDKP